MSTVEIIKSSLPEWAAGNGSVAQTPIQLPAFNAKCKVVIRANADNDAVICVGPFSGSASSGFLLAGGETQEFYVDSTQKIWLVAASGTQDYSWYAV